MPESHRERDSNAILEPGTTGRSLVVFVDIVGQASTDAVLQQLNIDVVGPAVAAAGVASTRALKANQGVVLPAVGIAVVATPPSELQARAVASGAAAAVIIEPEFYKHTASRFTERVSASMEVSPRIGTSQVALDQASFAARGATLTLDYLLGYRDGIVQLVDKFVSTTAGVPVSAAIDESRTTWGLQLTKVIESPFSGRDISVAVLDTGFDLEHPDFQGRQVVSQSFVEGEEVQDGKGHGTHCIGTACGPRQPSQNPRYGIAHQANIYAGKVLSNAGFGNDGDILAGIEWALQNRCHIISMSLSSRVPLGGSYSQAYEQAASRALEKEVLVIAAAGNDSARPGVINPVGSPANCPSIMAVAAVDSRLQVASFSSGGRNNEDGGEVNIAGPGVAVRSSWPRPTLYNTLSGTSMAAPHIAGIAALYAERDAKMRGRALWDQILVTASRLNLPATDVGAGFVQAPTR